MSINLQILQENLKHLRISRGFSQEDIAEKLYISRSTYSYYESGCKIADLHTLDALASIYDVSLDSLLNCDLSNGMLGEIYFCENKKSLAELLNSYQALSISAKFLVMLKLDDLLEAEKTKALHEQHHKNIDG